MRRLFGSAASASSLVFAVTLVVASTAMAAPRERLAMPFTCGFDNGRLTLMPSPERSYTIMGARDQRPFTVCRQPSSLACRTFMVHRFAIACAGVRVPWVRVIAAANETAGGRVWLNGGKLNIERPIAPAEGDARACIDPPAHIGGPPVARMAHECLPWKPARLIEKMALPAGFAPVGELGARFVFGGASPVDGQVGLFLAAAGPGDADPSQTLSGSASGSHQDTNAVLREPLPAIGAGSSPSEWVTVIEARDLSGEWFWPAGAREDWTPMTAIGLVALVGLAWFGWSRKRGAIIEVWRRLRRMTARPVAAGEIDIPDAQTATDAAFSAAADQVAALLRQTESTVLSLKTATPLRDVLEEEVHLMSRRLVVLSASTLDSKASAEKISGQFRALVRDLERVRRIASSAAASLSGSAREAQIMPATKSEAYDILGVNADVSEVTLKKIVDALRMTWHPDHARDDDDRRLREARIKQINIAWDLINEKRRAA